ncbi:GHKL domain-containing protein [Coprococcus eutactus]|uniref:GHKL domain-containing protein n=1 Tax=Coprococcus eutactus TaxID=33043 RepID=UPI001C00EACD|nr:GHKL domain-containing protein [Coprococcus eutactus]MBT9731645.1 GHKL domain-containing protein [Coprococcus eutactus]
MLYCILFLLINIEYVSFYYVFWGKRANIKYDWKLLVTLCISVLLLVLSIGIGNLDILCVPAIISGVLINSQIYRLRVSETIKLVLVSFPLLSILESIFEFILMYGVKLEPEYVNIVYTVVVVAIIWTYYWTIGRRIDRDAFLLPGKMSLVVSAALFAIEAMISYFTFVLVDVLQIDGEMIGLGIVIASGVVIVVLILLMIYYFNVQNKYQIENSILERFNEQQREYFEQLLEKEQRTRQFRHDIIAELIQIKNYEDRKEYEKLGSYLDEMLSDISSISKYDYDVGNEIVNTILNYYLLPIKDKCKIEVKGYISDSMDIARRDLCILVSNLVKNAVEAVEQVSDKEKYIFFEIKSGNIFLQINMRNTCAEHTGITKAGEIYTTKVDKINHGLGIKNIENTLRRYEGYAEYKIEDNCFVSEIMVKSNRSSSI